MQPRKNKSAEYLEAFSRPSLCASKTSAEIVNEARKALRTLGTQRPFTPRETQRKLFGAASSRTPENRPPSAFSLHASNFESVESRPVSSIRLTPLDHKPKLLPSPQNDEDHPISPPIPPVNSRNIQKTSSARARLLRTASYGNLLDKASLPKESEKLYLEDQMTVCDASRSVNESFSGNSAVQLSNTDNCLPQTYIEHRKITGEEICPQKTTIPFPPRSSNQRDQVNNQELLSLHVDSTEWINSATKSVSEYNWGVNETEKEEKYWDMKILPLLHELESEDSIEKLCQTCTIIYQALKEGNMLGRKFKRRTLVLKTVYKLVDIPSDLLGLKLAKIILGLKVSGKNLLNVCKLVFKISRNEKNDSLIQNDQIVDSLLEILRAEDLQANTEAFLYCMGALKFMSGNSRLINEMVSKGTVEVVLQLLKQINEINENDAQFSSSGHILVQLTATLRSLVDLPQSRYKLLDCGAIQNLCLLLEKYVNDKDVCTNVARIFSKLSSFNDCCAALADCSRCYILFLALLNKHPKKQDLVVRIIFTLGNLTAKSNCAREQFFEAPGSMNTMIALFQMNYEADSNHNELKNLKHPSEAEEVLIKLIRVIANLSIHPGVGASITTNHEIVSLLMTILEHRSVDECEELVINATATINNLSFYQVKNSVIQEKKLIIAKLLLKLLMSSNMDGILEAIRVFGNLSQYHEICDFIIQQKVYKFMIALLDAKHQDVCFSACGVLLNLTVDKSRRQVLSEEGGIKKLIDCLKDFAPTDWQLACLICKTLWNYSENFTSTESYFCDDESTALSFLLSSFLDEEVAMGYNLDNDLRDYHKLYWETEFRPVAQKLLQRIQS